MKTLALLSLLISTSAFADPTYTLQSICSTYGKVGKCQSVDFCEEKAQVEGCVLAEGAPAYMDGMCKLQTQKWGCDIMQQQGNCVWQQAQDTCVAKFNSL